MNNFIKFLIFTFVFTMSFGILAPMPADSAGVVMLLGVGSSASGTLAYPVLSQSDAEMAVSTASDVYVKYKTSADEYASDDYVIITASAGLTLANCGSPTTDADGDATGDISYRTLSGQTLTYYFDQATTLASGASVDFCINITTPATPGNYSIVITDSKAAGAEDFGAALLYVGDDNDVTVHAIVQSELEFRIRNEADTADTNDCDLGVLSSSSVSTCNYRLKVKTNASSGYTVSWTSDGALDTSDGTSDIDAVTEADGSVTAGAEEYGVAFYGGENSDATSSCTEQNIWNDDDTPVSTTATSLLVCDGPNQPASSGELTNTSTMDHKASITATTFSGNYEQVVTYYVTGNF